MATYGQGEWRREVAHGHQMATHFARKDKVCPLWLQYLGAEWLLWPVHNQETASLTWFKQAKL